MIAALYVDHDGIYAGTEDIDLWPASRDARLYDGPWPVVAHPPCERWGAFARSIWGRVGEDDGCFASALAAVEKWGGVLEHPASSSAWTAFRLPMPPRSGGWVRSLFRPGWSCHVEQGHYGHPAPKATWLYYVGAELPPPMPWGQAPLAMVDSCPSVGRTRGRTVEVLTKKERRHTPPDFAAVLLRMARRSCVAPSGPASLLVAP